MREATVATFGGGEPWTPYLTRVVLGRLRIHVFHRGDNDPDLHDHPSDFWTFPLISYVEEYQSDDGLLVERVVRAFRLHHRRAEFAHRLVRAAYQPGPIASIVWWGRKRRDWGFHTADGWVRWQDYHGVDA